MCVWPRIFSNPFSISPNRARKTREIIRESGFAYSCSSSFLLFLPVKSRCFRYIFNHLLFHCIYKRKGVRWIKEGNINWTIFIRSLSKANCSICWSLANVRVHSINGFTKLFDIYCYCYNVIVEESNSSAVHYNSSKCIRWINFEYHVSNKLMFDYSELYRQSIIYYHWKKKHNWNENFLEK